MRRNQNGPRRTLKEREEDMAKLTWIAAICGTMALTACGQTDAERGLTGAVMGAAAGQVITGDPVTGALLGGAAGATCRSLGTCPNN